MDRLTLERRQVWIHLAAILAGLALGSVWPALAPVLEALRLGVLAVLLVPCTDWFVTFAPLGRGDVARAIAVTPLNLFLQLPLLPAWLWLLLPSQELAAVIQPRMVWASLALVGVPLLLAALTGRWMEARPGRLRWREPLAWWAVPLLAVVVFLIAAAQVGTVRDAGPMLLSVLPFAPAPLRPGGLP